MVGSSSVTSLVPNAANMLLYVIQYLDSTRFTHLGCFRDRPRRAIAGRIYWFRPHEAIQKCFELAKRLGNTVFSVQYNSQCFTHATAENTYARYGRATGCRNGRGGGWRNDVYKSKSLLYLLSLGQKKKSLWFA